MKSETQPTIVVHGGFVDGSGWQGTYNILRKQGYTVRIVQNPTISLTDDVAATRRVVNAQEGPVDPRGALVRRCGCHGGRQRSEGRGLVYVAAFAPDKGESVWSLIKDPPPGAPVPPILPPQEGFLLLDASKFVASFAADVDAETADSWPSRSCRGASTRWKVRHGHPRGARSPSWYLVAADDKMIPPPAQRAMATRAGSTITETGGSHSVYVSKPAAVAAIIATATNSVAVAAQ